MTSMDHEAEVLKTVSAPPPMLMAEQASADALGVSLPTFRKWVRHGHLSAVVLPGGTARKLCRTADLERFAASLAAKS